MLLLGYCHIGCGQEQVLVDTLNVQVYFRQGYSILEFDYRDNAKRLAAFVDSVRTLQGSASCRVKTFRIVGTASPEGVSVLNKRLSENRAKNLVAWIEEYISLEGATLDIQALGIDWERLERQVVASDMPYRDEVLEILRNTPVWVIRDGKVVDSRNRQLGSVKTNYEATYAGSEKTLTGTAASIMAVEDDNAMLIPQQLIAWTPDTDKTNTNKGAYLAVKVNITTKDGARVYPSVGEYDWVAVAVNTKWEPGQKYVYTLDFSNGAGKVDPEKPMPGPTDPFKPGEDVLGSAIKFTVTVTPWTPASEDVTM